MKFVANFHVVSASLGRMSRMSNVVSNEFSITNADCQLFNSMDCLFRIGRVRLSACTAYVTTRAMS